MQIESTRTAPAQQSPALVAAAKLEQAFLEEMLKYCGPKPTEGSFSGGAGEEQFTSFLTQQYAARLSGRLNLGFAAMLERRA